MTTGAGNEPLANNERAELMHLREEVAALRAEVAAAPTTATATAEQPRPPRHLWRRSAVLILLVVVAVVSIASVTSRFVRSQILDTDRYVATVTPLAADPAVQSEITRQVSDAIFARVDFQSLTTQALTALAAVPRLDENAPRANQLLLGLSPVLAGQAEDFVEDTVATFVQSQQFEDLWVQANRRAHTALVAVVTGNYGLSSVEVDRSGTVSISLGTVIDNVRTQLTDRGFTFAENIPTVDEQFVLFQSPELVRSQRAVDALDRLSAVLPWIGLACAAAAVALAPRGRRLHTLSLAGAAIAAGMLIVAVALVVVRTVYLDDIPPDVLSRDAAAAIVDTLLVPLRTGVRAVAVVGLVVAIGAYLTGSSASATAVRRGFRRTLDVVRRDRSRTPGSVEVWAGRLRVPLRCTIIGVAALLLVFWRYPTGIVVLWIVLGAVLALLALEVLIRPTRPGRADGDHHPSADATAAETEVNSARAASAPGTRPR